MPLSKPIAQPKPRPSALDRADRRKARAALDTAQNEKVLVRSGGRCEVDFIGGVSAVAETIWFAQTGEHPRNRCIRRAVHVHHRLSGIGTRARGASALAENKLHVCEKCHSEIHAHVLVPDGASFFRRLR